MPNYYMVNYDTHDLTEEPVVADSRPWMGGDFGFLNEVQADAYLRQEDPDNEGSSIEGAHMKDGAVFCMGCIPDTAATEDVHVYLWDNPDKTEGMWVCTGCGNTILEDYADTAEENTTTCWGCGDDRPDGEMVRRPCGEGEYCPTCAKVNAAEWGEE
jgi:hypothetical protein